MNQQPPPYYSQAVGNDFGNMSAGPFVNQQTSYADTAGSAFLPQFGDMQPQPIRRAMGDDAALQTAKKTVMWLGGLAGGIIGAYHGYKRNDSLGWALGWALLGGIAWPIVIPVAFAQGIGERK